ncbi:hypothetical protein [Arcanobacterium ihumii]|uniref:hypothetical protein n=1 Tax=Arcanobacterium ihumii TaxID=2138162 RepID=UPI001F3CFC4F|nr:hypothetical protein [Arcanobacterium ihumii]
MVCTLVSHGINRLKAQCRRQHPVLYALALDTPVLMAIIGIFFDHEIQAQHLSILTSLSLGLISTLPVLIFGVVLIQRERTAEQS